MGFVIISIILFIITACNADSKFFTFIAHDIESDDEINMKIYKGKVLLIVNVASECGFTENHYRELVDLQRSYDYGKFQVLAFPCNQFGKQEPKKNKHILDFANNNYNVNFQMFTKVKTTGSNAHPLFKWLKEASGREPDWNFCKYLLNHKGEVVRYASSAISPIEMEKDIRKLLAYEKLNGGVMYYEHFDDEVEHEEL